MCTPVNVTEDQLYQSTFVYEEMMNEYTVYGLHNLSN